MTVIRTADGDMIDDIAARYYGRRDGEMTALVLDANPALCEQPARLPGGLSIYLPDEYIATDTAQGVRLWD